MNGPPTRKPPPGRARADSDRTAATDIAASIPTASTDTSGTRIGGGR